MKFPISIALEARTSLSDIEKAMQHLLDTVVIPIHQNNWRKILGLMDIVNSQGWDINFVLWAKGGQVKRVPLHKLANHLRLTGWLIQDISDSTLIAMLKATTELGIVWAWAKKVPFTEGVLSPQPAGTKWWAWVSLNESMETARKVYAALLSGAEGICFSNLPTEDEFTGKECLKAIGFLATHLRLWNPLLAERPAFTEAWSWKTDEAFGWIWQLEDEELLCLFSTQSLLPSLTLKLPLATREGFRPYGVRFPALVRLPFQRKGENTLIKFNAPEPLNLVWLTNNSERIKKMHQHVNKLLPKAMQFSVQWVLTRKERLNQEKKTLPDVETQIWSMLQKAKRRQFSHGYLSARQILKSLGDLPLTSQDW
jgi:hypothetical protein